MADIRAQLVALQDPAYRDFNAGLLPTVAKEAILGVRTPELRKLARALDGTPEAAEFLTQLPHGLFEENNLHALLIAQRRDFDACIAALEAFLPFIDNWATCDILSPKCFEKHKAELLTHIRSWMASEHVYTCRFGIGMLLRWYLDDDFQPEYLDAVAAVRSEEYYINMMIAWCFATALTKQFDAALPLISERRLAPWTHNKAIQKACESARIPPERKALLRTMKVKAMK